MSYHPEDYQVVNTNFNEDGTVRSFDVTIKGADFIIYRHLNRFKPTKTFKFNKHIGLIVGEDNIATGTVEIDWDTCTSGMLHLAEQMGLNYIPCGSPYANNWKESTFEEVEQ